MESHPSAAAPSFTIFAVTLRVYKISLGIERVFPCGLIGKNANSDNPLTKSAHCFLSNPVNIHKHPYRYNYFLHKKYSPSRQDCINILVRPPLFPEAVQSSNLRSSRTVYRMTGRLTKGTVFPLSGRYGSRLCYSQYPVHNHPIPVDKSVRKSSPSHG